MSTSSLLLILAFTSSSFQLLGGWSSNNQCSSPSNWDSPYRLQQALSIHFDNWISDSQHDRVRVRRILTRQSSIRGYIAIFRRTRNDQTDYIGVKVYIDSDNQVTIKSVINDDNWNNVALALNINLGLDNRDYNCGIPDSNFNIDANINLNLGGYDDASLDLNLGLNLGGDHNDSNIDANLGLNLGGDHNDSNLGLNTDINLNLGGNNRGGRNYINGRNDGLLGILGLGN